MNIPYMEHMGWIVFVVSRCVKMFLVHNQKKLFN
jgi:hypothetical protein